MSESTDAALRPRNTAGRVSLGLAVVVVIVNVAQQIVVQLAPYIQSRADLSASQIALVFLPFGITAGLFAAAAVIAGIIGLTRAALPKGAAGAGTAIGATTLIALSMNVVASLIYRLAA